MGGLVDTVMNTLGSGADAIGGAGDAVVSVVDPVMDAIVVPVMESTVVPVGEAAGSAFEGGMGAIGNAGNAFGGAATDVIGGAAEAVVDPIMENYVAPALDNTVGRVTNAVGGVTGDVVNWGMESGVIPSIAFSLATGIPTTMGASSPSIVGPSMGAVRGAASNPDNPLLGAARGAAMGSIGPMANMPTDTSNYTASDWVNAANNQDWSQYANPALHTADTAYNTYNKINTTANAIDRIANGPPQRPGMRRPAMGSPLQQAAPRYIASPQQQFTANNSALVGGRPLNTTGSAGLIRSVPNMRRQVPTMKFAQGGLVQFSKTRRSK